MANIERHKQLCAQLTDTYQKKNADYGNSFGDTFADLGIISAITRIADLSLIHISEPTRP